VSWTMMRGMEESITLVMVAAPPSKLHGVVVRAARHSGRETMDVSDESLRIWVSP